MAAPLTSASFDFSPCRTVGELLHHYPAAVATLRRHGIDPAHAGLRLADAAEQQAHGGEELMEILALDLPTDPTAGDEDCGAMTLEELIDHLLVHHHAYTRRELARMRFLAHRCIAHVASRAAFARLEHTLEHAIDHLLAHLDDEEQHLFPLAQALDHPERERPASHDDTERHLMAVEHDHADLTRELANLRRVIRGAPWAPEHDRHLDAIHRSLDDLIGDLVRHSDTEEEYLIPAIAYAEELFDHRASQRHPGR